MSVIFARGAIFSSEVTAQEPSAFDVFKTFCIDTDIRKDAMSSKALSLGAVPFNPPENVAGDAIARFAKIREDEAAWLVKLGSRQFRVHFSAMDLPASVGQHAIRSDSCNVYFESEDARADDDLTHWVGLPDGEAIKHPGIDEISFEFRIKDGKHMPLPKGWRVDPTFPETVTWRADVSHFRSLSMSLMRAKSF